MQRLTQGLRPHGTWLSYNNIVFQSMNISIIVPAYNEENKITDSLEHLKKCISEFGGSELIVVDGGSDDNTVELARKAGADCLVSDKKGRAAQMNAGAKYAAGDILYFVHADSIPPETFISDILKAVDEGFDAGCYRFRFDSDYPLLKINAFMTRFDRIMCRGGDQTLFITRKLFEQLGGYKEEYMIMEDYDLIKRIQERARFKIIPKDVIVSSRKYLNNGYFKVQVANFIVFMMYFLDYPQEKMVNTYKRLIYHPKF